MNVNLHLIDFKQPLDKVLNDLQDAWIEYDINQPGCYCSVALMPPCYHCESSNDRFYEWVVEMEDSFPASFNTELLMKGYIE